MHKSKDIFLLLFFVLAALVIGGLVGELTAGIPWLKWLTYGQSIGFNSEGAVHLSVLQIILITAALLIYRKVR